MRYIKIMAIAALTALAVMAVAAGSASASAKVCSTSGGGNACESGHGKSYSGVIKAALTTGTNAKLTASNGGTVTCTESASEGEVSNGETGTGKLTKLTFNSCTSTTICSGATTAETNASTTSPWNATATTTTAGVSNTNGKMDILNTDVTATIKCLGITTCIYKAENPTVDITGSDVAGGARLNAEAVPLTKTFGSEGTCGTSATWTATYSISSPSTLMIE